MGDDWRRRFRFVIPVRRPDVWASRELIGLLTDTLSFLSEDDYQFEFVHHQTPVPLDSYFDFRDPVGDDENADEVVLFSGGLDSLAGAVEDLLGRQKRVVLVSHHSSTKLAGRQRALASALEQKARDRVLHVPVRMTKRSGKSVEYSQRSRSFFFVALGAVVARIVGTRRVRLYENGIVSVNLPLAENVIGARATRSTHPGVIAGLNQLLACLFPDAIAIENPYALLTKAEVLERIEAHGCADLIPQTVSCSRVYQIETDRPHCGECTQCLGRRFAVLSAGLEQHDPEDGYRVRLFVDERCEGTRRALAVSYIELARGLGRMSPRDFLARSSFHAPSRICQGVERTTCSSSSSSIEDSAPR
jgi:7-cyano-7-deazaguanine synthase in queuosine biosynthesis